MRSQLINSDVATESGSWNKAERAACVSFAVLLLCLYWFVGLWLGECARQ
jgi:hypothetical protein